LVSCCTKIVQVKNVTITLDEDVARWARVQAAKRNTSVSRLVGELLRQYMKDEEAYASATESHLARMPKRLRRHGEAYPKRDELHDRHRLR
jgi:plasmid stability protein